MQVRAKTVDALPAGAESLTLQQLIPTFWSPARLEPADSFTTFPPKNTITALILQLALIYISWHVCLKYEFRILHETGVVVSKVA